MSKFFSLVFCLISLSELCAQQIPLLERKVTIKAENSSVTEVLQSISKQTYIRFSYNPDILKNIPPQTFYMQQKPVRIVLKKILGENIKLKERGRYIILQKEKATEKVKVIEGYINEPLTGQKIGQATVYDRNTYASAITNQYGYFRIEVPESDTNNVIMVSKAGKSDTLLNIIPNKSQFVEVNFAPSAKDSIRPQTVVYKPDSAKKNTFFPDWLVSESLLINTFNLNDTFFKSVNLSVLPFVSTNRLLTGNSVNNISINLTVGYCQEIRMAEFGMINIVRDNVRFVQLGYFGNIVGGHMFGYQASAFFNISNSLRGMQHSGFLNICHYVDGGQIASFFNKSNRVRGVQMAGILNKTNQLTGVQAAGICNIADTISGLQLAGIVNNSGTVSAAQIAGIANTSKRTNKAQVASIINKSDTASNQIAGIINVSVQSDAQVAGVINIGRNIEKVQVAGLLNYGRDVEGVQVAGLVNIVQKIKGIQLGVVNIADTCDGLAIGVLSFVNHGVHSVELGVDETAFGSVSVRTGVKKFYNILAFGTKPDGSDKAWYVGYGLGTSWDLNEKFALFGEINKQDYFIGNQFNSWVEMMKISIGTTWQWKKKIALSGSVSFNLMNHDVVDDQEVSLSKKIAPYRILTNQMNDGSELNSWIGAKLGIRFF